MNRISARFADELEAAGLLGIRVSWGGDGSLEYAPDVTPEQRAAVEAVLAAHDPAMPRDEALVRREERREALVALVGVDAADAALDGFLRAIKARPGLPPEVAAYIEKHGL
jgi:hypothetical protein